MKIVNIIIRVGLGLMLLLLQRYFSNGFINDMKIIPLEGNPVQFGVWYKLKYFGDRENLTVKSGIVTLKLKVNFKGAFDSHFLNLQNLPNLSVFHLIHNFQT